MTKDLLAHANVLQHQIEEKQRKINLLKQMATSKTPISISHAQYTSVSLTNDWSYEIIDFAIDQLTEEIGSLEDRFREL